MRSQKVPVSGMATTAPNGKPTRKFMIGALPIDGAWSFTGRVLALNPASGRQNTRQVQFNINASGACTAGVAQETDGIASGSAWPT
jgi:hypothetical protein